MISYASNTFRRASLLFLLYVSLAAFLFVPIFTQAQSISLSVGKPSYSEGDNILVTVSIATNGHPINTIGGVVTFDPGAVSIADIRYGSSIVSLWVDKPTADQSGNIVFTGGVPGGFSGGSGTIFSFMAKIKKAGP